MLKYALYLFQYASSGLLQFKIRYFIFQLPEQSAIQTIQMIPNQYNPLLTIILNFQPETEQFLLYGQFYPYYQLITLFKYNQGQFINLTTWQSGVQTFDVSEQYIYIIENEGNAIYQVFINQSYQFVISYVFRQAAYTMMSSIKVTNFYFSYSQCDFLSVGTTDNVGSALVFFQAWNSSIIIFKTNNNNLLNVGQSSSLTKQISMMFSQQFFLYQAGDIIAFTEIGNPFSEMDFTFEIRMARQQQKNQTKSINIYIYLNPYTNYLFLFSNEIQIYSLRIPELQVQNNKIIQNRFKIYAFQSYEINPRIPFDPFCFIEFEIQTINPNNTNVYVNFNQSNIFYNALLTNPFEYQIKNIDGPLLSTTGMLSNTYIGTFQETTLKLCSIYFNQQFKITNMLNVTNIMLPSTIQNLTIFQPRIFFVGATDQHIFFYLCSIEFECNQIYQDLLEESISAIQITYSFYGEFLVGISYGNVDIVVYCVNNSIINNQTTLPQKLYFTFPRYKQYFLNYDNIVLLLLNNEIQIQSLKSSETKTIGKNDLINYFSNFVDEKRQFNLINMEMNQAYQSSILYINNNNSFIILVIQNTNTILPLSLVFVNISIHQLNIINYQLVLSFECLEYICFQIWNVQNLIKPIYIKSMPKIQMMKGWNIQSDNLFLYVQGSNSTIFVYNPLLSYHSSFYYQFQISNNYFSSISIGTFSIISYQNFIVTLSAIMLQQFASNQNQSQNYITQSYFNFSVSNQFSSSSETQNILLTLINPQTEILPSVEIEQQFVQHENILINLSEIINLKLFFTNQEDYYNDSNYCNLSNYIQFGNIIGDIPQISNKSQLIILNQTLVVQNGLQFISLNTTIQGNNVMIANVQNTNLSNPFNLSQVDQYYCNTTSFYNETIVSQMCLLIQNNQLSWHLIQFEFLCFNPYDCNIYNQNIFNFSNTSNLFQTIIKQTSINQQNQLLLATQEGLLDHQLYLLQISQLINQTNFYQASNLYIQCNSGIADYAIFSVPKQPNIIIILFICDTKLQYVVGALDSNGNFQNVQVINSFVVFDTQSFIQPGLSKLVSINILSQNQYTLILLLTTKNAISFILTASQTFNSIGQQEIFSLTIQKVVQTIPPYGYSLKQTWAQNGLILIQYQFKNRSVYAIYDWMASNDSITNPLMMKGGYEQFNESLSTTLNISSSLKGGIIYQIKQGNLSVFIVSANSYLNCTFQSKKDSEQMIVANNYFSKGSIVIKFQYTPQKQWFIGLLIFLGIIFMIAIFFYWYKTKDIIENDSLLEEIELEQ